MSRIIALAALTAVALFSAQPYAEAQEMIGRVAAVEGSPTAAGPGGSRRLSGGSELFVGDRVIVGPGSNAQLILDDGTKLVVGPSSQLVLQTYLRRNNAQASKVAVRALRGTYRFISGNSSKSAYSIKTPNATIGIRGTGFDFTVTNDTVAAVLEGKIRISGNNGQSVDASAGCGVAEAGAGNTKARELEGEEKANALNNELPYITDQSPLTTPFHLPVNNCLTSLGSNDAGATQGAAAAAGAAAAVTIPAIILLADDEEDDPISGEPGGGDEGGGDPGG